MDYKKYVYEDETGGGDDVILEAPEWAHPPKELAMRTDDGDVLYFELSEEE